MTAAREAKGHPFGARITARWQLLRGRPLHALARLIDDPPSPLRTELLHRAGMHLRLHRQGNAGWNRSDTQAWMRADAAVHCGDGDAALNSLATLRSPNAATIRRIACSLWPLLPEEAGRWARRLPDGDAVRSAWAERAEDSVSTPSSDPFLRCNQRNTAGDETAWHACLGTAFINYGLAAPQLDQPRLGGAHRFVCAEPPPGVDGPLVTVVVTTFDLGDRLVGSLNSLRRQTWRSLQILVVDDASTDDSWNILQQLASEDSRIAIERSPANEGPYRCRNRALARAKGAFVTFHDADDWAHPERIQRQVEALRDQRLVATLSEWVRFDDTGRFGGRFLWPLRRLNPSSLLFRREPVLSIAGGFDPVRTGADSEFTARLRLLFGSLAVKKLSLPLAIGAERSDSLTNHPMSGGRTPRGLLQRATYWDVWNSLHLQHLSGSTRHFPMPIGDEQCDSPARSL